MHKMSTKNSDMIKFQHFWIGSGARLMDSRCMRKHFVEREMRMLLNDKVSQI